LGDDANNLGATLHGLAVRSEGPQAAVYLEQAAAPTAALWK
jgi:hypothetical protein